MGEGSAHGVLSLLVLGLCWAALLLLIFWPRRESAWRINERHQAFLSRGFQVPSRGGPEEEP